MHDSLSTPHRHEVGHLLVPGKANTLTIRIDNGKKSEFSPGALRLTARFESQAGDSETTTATGFRRLHAEGRGLFVNGRPTFLRGTLECCIFPKTGHPDMDGAEWEKAMRAIRDHGLNHLRFHSWYSPPSACSTTPVSSRHSGRHCIFPTNPALSVPPSTRNTRCSAISRLPPTPNGRASFPASTMAADETIRRRRGTATASPSPAAVLPRMPPVRGGDIGEAFHPCSQLDRRVRVTPASFHSPSFPSP